MNRIIPGAIILLGVAGALFFGLSTTIFSPHTPPGEAAKALTSQETAQDGLSSTPDLSGNEMTQPQTPEEIKQMDVQAEAGRFQIARLGMDVPLNSMVTVDNRATPPGFRSAYFLRDHGVAPANGDKGTVYVLMHSSTANGYAPGNFLVTADGHMLSSAGDTILVDGITYRITHERNISKKALPSDAEVWSDNPNRLVVITCQQDNGNVTVNNTVIFAERV